ncbi:MAG: flippase-like domain-containing protein [Clostridia bacterium]|nr:flippase-like domain-containing protein [Clostridia bacterium]
MSAKLKKILSFFFIAASVTIVLIIAFSNTELKDAWGTISKLDLWWLAGIFGCWIVCAVFDGLNYWCYLRREKFKISIGRAINVSLIGFYYSNITPSAAGGQPMQVNSLRKAGIPVGYGTMAVTIRFFTNQFTISLMSLLLFLFNRAFVYEKLGGVMWLVRIGWLINFAAVPLVILATWKRNWIQGIASWLVGLLARMRIIKNKDAMLQKVTEVLDTYNKAMVDLLKRPGQIAIQFLCSFISLLGLTATIIFVYHAFGQHGTPWYRILTLSSLLYVSASYTPLPGASGAQEGGFLVFFKDVFKNGTIGMALLTWRFFTFYLFLIVGVGTVVLEKIILKHEKKLRFLRGRKPETDTEQPAEAETEKHSDQSGNQEESIQNEPEE